MCHFVRGLVIVCNFDGGVGLVSWQAVCLKVHTICTMVDHPSHKMVEGVNSVDCLTQVVLWGTRGANDVGHLFSACMIDPVSAVVLIVCRSRADDEAGRGGRVFLTVRLCVCRPRLGLWNAVCENLLGSIGDCVSHTHNCVVRETWCRH